MTTESAATMTSNAPESRSVRPRSLLIIAGEHVSSMALLDDGVVRIGRSRECEIALDDELVSREHARLICTSRGVEVEDLNSANGTRMNGVSIAGQTPVPVRAGDVIECGTSVFLLQHPGRDAVSSRLTTHSHFESRLGEACARSRDRGFVVLRLSVRGTATPLFLQEAVSRVLSLQDMVASYGPGEYEIMLLNAEPARVSQIIERLSSELSHGGLEVNLGAATFPRDGNTPDALLEKASAALLGKQDLPTHEGVVIDSPAMKALYGVAERVAKGKISVLLLGETGVGKEVVAEWIHRASTRAANPYIRLNCAALNETLFDSEVFGHEKGAFTGATSSKAGLLEAANGGTIFLDELGELPLGSQAKLLRALEQQEVLRVGSLTPRRIDVRFVSATNRDLEGEIKKGTFRSDLYYRLGGVTISIPPLRDRREEIAALARVFSARGASDLGRPEMTIAPRALETLEGYTWPGNIRELRNVIERAILLAPNATIELEHLPLEKMTVAWNIAPPQKPAAPQIELADGDLSEKERILKCLEQFGGNQTRAALALGISRRTLINRLDAYGVARPKKQEPVA